jgi:D-beta-D-heptose 7-phosphate kinase/D-beta-D-heptose 1-phosphate adenosyltransferase
MNDFRREWDRIAVQYGGGQPIAFTNGCFDIFHAGHVKLLAHMRWLCPSHVIVVGLNSDASVRRLKGSSRPINKLADRQAVLEACRFVDHVLPFDEDTPLELIRRIGPDVLVKDARYRGKRVVGAFVVRGNGGKVCFVDPLKGVSTTGIIRKAKRRGR